MLHRTQNGDRKRRGILQRVREMLASPPQTLRLRRAARIHRPPHPPILNQTLSEPYSRRHADQQRHEEDPATAAIRSCCAVPLVQHHAQRDEKVAEDFRIRCQHISGKDIPELPLRCFRDAAYGYAAEDVEESCAAVAGDGEGGEEGAD